MVIIFIKYIYLGIIFYNYGFFSLIWMTIIIDLSKIHLLHLIAKNNDVRLIQEYLAEDLEE